MFAPTTIFNNATGFMEARNANGDWAGPDNGWTEGDKWAYSFDIVHAVQELISLRGGKANFVRSLDEHFAGGEFFDFDFVSWNPIHPLSVAGHNDHTNEVCVPWMASSARLIVRDQAFTSHPIPLCFGRRSFEGSDAHPPDCSD